MAKAVQALQAKQVNRIILTRPAVEAGERLGFLPGTLSEKIDPYLRPLYDALHDMIDPESIPQAAGRRHHRGRAAGLHARPHAERRVHHPRRGAEHLARADEDVPDPARLRLARWWSPATSPRSTCPAGTQSGLRVVEDILDGIEDVDFCRLTAHDVVRHRLVGEIVDAYERCDDAEQRAARRRDARPSGEAQPMSIEVLNESGFELDEPELVGAEPVRAWTRCACTRSAELCVGSSTRRPSPSCTCSGWTSRARPTC